MKSVDTDASNAFGQDDFLAETGITASLAL
jgi:hypothetical protein